MENPCTSGTASSASAADDRSPLDRADRRAGAIYGLAFGDAWGFGVEFASYQRILNVYGVRGPEFPSLAAVTDDTQMSIALAQALDDTARLGGLSPLRPTDLRKALLQRFLGWLHDPDNNRAPGNACLTALYAVERLGTEFWSTASVANSKGCGTVMRAPWLGVDSRLSDSEVGDAAALQSVLTHAHATATVSAMVTARTTRELFSGRIGAAEALDWAIEHVAARPGIDTEVLGAIWEKEGRQSAQEYLDVGWAELAEALDRARLGLHPLSDDPWGSDPCEYGGAGWIAEEALATSLLITTTFAADPVNGLRRAVATGGDSDSLAAVVGGLLGAGCGMVWPELWTQRLEPRYRSELAAIRPM
ncbi:ADP-ribosylglycohydrolase family protein [Actinoalloteichus hymeniacidonis]|uniref:ADP-ribosylglycohydrolase n=1 Tax=Actinoalloteichus hymeniacidonis TaxID=340345 RepID=A0AAC9MWK6_9PSEU|nr:ADP-ribosylglycohydrolase family protein [Actinoalloteichus hymeniacidonis]AOS61395.1 ADP-ribosylglycohydrolase [Actinoalloteichus hymeniacidonis]MBB5910600.1 ADP-ribosylglycohydrolase [Actinoalloteichus hymeniacidonis]